MTKKVWADPGDNFSRQQKWLEAPSSKEKIILLDKVVPVTVEAQAVKMVLYFVGISDQDQQRADIL